MAFQNKEILLRCDCNCSVFTIEFLPEFSDEPDQWFWEIYHNYNPHDSWRGNLKMAWALIRGHAPKGECGEAQIIYRKEIEKLRDFLTETLNTGKEDNNE